MRIAARVMSHVQPMKTTGTHEFHRGRLADTGVEVVSKHNLFTNFLHWGWGQPFNPTICTAFQMRYPRMDRLQDMSEIMLSWFSKEYFERQGRSYPGVTWSEVVYRDDKGKAHLEIAAPVVENFGSLEDRKLIDIVSNPAEAVEQSLLRGLVFGDYDVTFHDDNTAVVTADGHTSDGQPLKKGQVLATDFGEAGHPGNRWLGVPYGSTTLRDRFPEHVGPAVENILKLNESAIRSMISLGGTHVTGWTDGLTEHFTRILTHNLERVRRKPPTEPSLNPLSLPVWNTAKYLAIAATQIPRNYEAVLRSGLLDAIPDNEGLAEVILAATR